MASRDLGLEYKLEDRKKKLRRLKERLEKIDKKIDEGVDFEEEEKLEARKDNTFVEISEINQEIEDIKQELQQQTEQAQENDFVLILQASDITLEILENVYRTTVNYLAVPAPVEITAASDIWKALAPIVCENQQYSAVEIFVACLMNGSQSSQLIHALRDWGQEYCPDSNWSAIYAAVQTELDARSQNFQPAILIKLSLAEEKTTQSGNQPYYRLEAWLIENLKTYQQQGQERRGHHNLIEAGTVAAEPFLIDNIELTMQPLLSQWLIRKKQLMNRCKLDPEFYVFLPKSLLH
ncbi:MAG: DUF342 domain-containing protein, partial [Leptolyngbya sp. SIO3F4]|nr:DUF342 domain-containing protein [Leptolyngbya sp. SIO3F4]